MSSKSVSDCCRVCGGGLHGNQRRWLFGGQNRNRKSGSEAGSLQSSPAGSTLSLRSSSSLSQLSLGSPSSRLDLLSILTHILGRPVSRGDGRPEFLCGKCVSVLERVFRFDAVISRVRVLSSERLQTLRQERDRVRQWVRQNHRQRHPEDGDGEGDGDAYRDMLRDNMALSEYECWSERWDVCPRFVRTGTRCRTGTGCSGCDVLRVSDSDYESVCGVPRVLPLSPLTRDKWRSMPLPQGAPSRGSSPSSLAGSRLSLRSLDSLDDPFDPADPAVLLVLKELRGLEGRRVRSPAGSRIPVLDRKSPGHAGGQASPSRGQASPSRGQASPTRGQASPTRTLDFGGVENGGGPEDVLMDPMDLGDEFLPLHDQNPAGRVQDAIRLLRGQLDQAEARIRTLEAELDRSGRSQTEVNGSADWNQLIQEDAAPPLLQSLGLSLHSRERLIQECVSLIRRVCVEEVEGEQLMDKLMENLKDMMSEDKVSLQTLQSDLVDSLGDMRGQVDALRTAGRDRDRDLDSLSLVLQGNQDLIHDLRVSLMERDQRLLEAEQEVEMWRRRDGAMRAALQEQTRVSQQAAGGGANLPDNQEGHSATLCLEVTRLTEALQDYQDLVQTQQEVHRRTVASLTEQLRDVQRRLREKETEQRERERSRQEAQEDGAREARRLREGLQRRDQLIQQILLDSEHRDFLFRELQQNLQNRRDPGTSRP